MKINKQNLKKIMKYYNNFHDGFIKTISYDVFESKINVEVDLYGLDNYASEQSENYKTNNIKLKLSFINVKKYCNSEIFSWDYIYKAVLKCIKIDNKEFFCFSTDEEKPLLYVVCEKIEYEIL